MTADQRAQFGQVYPDASMIKNEWPKHGTCSGLAPADYYALSTSTENAVTIPDAYKSPRALRTRDAKRVKQAFIAANQGLTADGINVVAANGVVTEIEICLTKQGAFRSCKAS